MHVKVIAFWTNQYYCDQAKRLEASLRKFNLSYHIRYVAGMTTWAEAVCSKPQFIRQQIEDTRFDGLLYTDCDSEFLKQPDFSAFKDCDLGAVWWQRSPHHETEILTGTMFFAANAVMRDFVNEWAQETPQYRHTFTPEQQSLKAVIGREKWSGLRVAKLPVEWCFIFDDHREMYPDAKATVQHYQASREFRRKEEEERRKAELGQNPG